jgi:hypothetical protein
LSLVDWQCGGGERFQALTIKWIRGGTGFGAGRTWELFYGQGGNLMAEMKIDRLWGIPGGFADQVPVIIEMEAG